MKKQKIETVKGLLSAAKKANLTEQETAWLQKHKYQVHGGV